MGTDLRPKSLRTERVQLRFTKDFVAEVDAARGDVSRRAWIERACALRLAVEAAEAEAQRHNPPGAPRGR